MTPPELYDQLSLTEAIVIQKELRKKIDISDFKGDIKLIGGADISFNKYEKTVYAGIIVLSYPDLKTITYSTIISETNFPYISGLLAFREIPAILKAWENLKIKPDILILDGQGIAHERRTGIATHFGILTNVPSIGCAKSVLKGKFREPENKIFATSYMYDKEDAIGIALRTKMNCNPVYISPGNKVSLLQSVEIIKNCTKNYRIPEPTRLAHLLVNKVRIENSINKNSQQSLF